MGKVRSDKVASPFFAISVKLRSLFFSKAKKKAEPNDKVIFFLAKHARKKGLCWFIEIGNISINQQSPFFLTR
jgi:hypothetical protein